MMPEECASMRSIARCVLPVLVGPNTAVTPEPGARSREEGVKAICAIGSGFGGRCQCHAARRHNYVKAAKRLVCRATVSKRDGFPLRIKPWNGLRTKRG